MNPAAAQSLDPKLKEVYDRVMGTELPKAASSPASASGQAWKAPTEQQPSHVPVEGMPTAAPQPIPAEPTPAPTPQAEPEMVSINTTAPQAKPTKNPRKLSPIIFVAGGVLFFVVYTVVWLKVFNIF